MLVSLDSITVYCLRTPGTGRQTDQTTFLNTIPHTVVHLRPRRPVIQPRQGRPQLSASACIARAYLSSKHYKIRAPEIVRQSPQPAPRHRSLPYGSSPFVSCHWSLSILLSLFPPSSRTSVTADLDDRDDNFLLTIPTVTSVGRDSDSSPTQVLLKAVLIPLAPHASLTCAGTFPPLTSLATKVPPVFFYERTSTTWLNPNSKPSVRPCDILSLDVFRALLGFNSKLCLRTRELYRVAQPHSTQADPGLDWSSTSHCLSLLTSFVAAPLENF